MAHDHPEPLLSVLVGPKTKADQERMLAGLKLLAAEDPTFKVANDVESSQIVLKGMDELHLDSLVDRLRRQFDVKADVSAPWVVYRETTSIEIEHTYTQKLLTAPDRGEFAEVTLVITPTDPGEGFLFESRIVGYAVPTVYIPFVEKGIKSVLGNGPLAGYTVTDLKVTLVAGKFMDVDSSFHAFEHAARMCMREGLQKAGLKLLEPIMKVEVVTPQEHSVEIIGDLINKRGIVQVQDNREGSLVINAMVPLVSLFGYIDALGSMSSGDANFSMKFDHYAPTHSKYVPHDDFPPASGKRT